MDSTNNVGNAMIAYIIPLSILPLVRTQSDPDLSSSLHSFSTNLLSLMYIWIPEIIVHSNELVSHETDNSWWIVWQWQALAVPGKSR